MALNDVAFCPVRGAENAILQMETRDGYLYFTTDTGKIYLGKNNEKILMGNAGSSIYFGILDNPEADANDNYIFNKQDIEDYEKYIIQIDDIILNKNGSFYRVRSIENDSYICSLLSVSGSGDGGEIYTRPSLVIEGLSNRNLINGQEARLYFTATSATKDGEIIDEKLSVHWSISTTSSGLTETYHTAIKDDVISGIRDYIDFGAYLRESTNSTITLYASGVNHDKNSYTRSESVITSELTLQLSTAFDNTTRQNNKIEVPCVFSGSTGKILEWSIDGKLVETKNYLGSTTTDTLSYSPVSHGAHKVQIRLYQNLGTTTNPVKGVETTPLVFEVPVIEPGNSNPIIWFGDYNSLYYNYDNIRIPFLAYDPNNTEKASVIMYKDDAEILKRDITDFSNFSIWQIVDADVNRTNFYSIACGTTKRQIQFEVQQDPERTMELEAQNQLILKLDAAGRSNDEVEALKKSWTDEEHSISCIFDNFNWYNNGWQYDNVEGMTALRISNGAKLTIPIGQLGFAGADEKQGISNTIECQFKIKNIQKYGNLITNITRYKNDDTTKYTDNNSNLREEEKGKSLFEVYEKRKAAGEVDNYDQFLHEFLSADDYEALEFDRVQKDIDLSYSVIQFGQKNDAAIVIGTQDAFFTNNTNTVNTDFVENEVINLSFVYQHELKLMFIYINGVITGVIKSTASKPFTINSDIIINSDICDIDLYKFRIYKSGLNVTQIVSNYAVDKKDVIIYDQRSLVDNNLVLKEPYVKFSGVVDYNKNTQHIKDDLYLMPYIIFDTSSYEDDKLPYSKKSGAREIKVEFVNTPLERAYTSGELKKLAIKDQLLLSTETDLTKINEAVQTYYKHHCPSWTSTLSAGDTVDISVQGTSSEFYPRRNFKVKTKRKDVEIYDEEKQSVELGSVLNIYMNRGPYAGVYNEDKVKLMEDSKYYGHEKSRLEDGWYMNNYTNATDRWTLKVDYMESSGSYNAGFASMVQTAYTKHPLKDYIDNNAISDNDGKLNSSVTGKCRWEDYRTSMQGFPVMAFQYRGEEKGYLFIGYYRMLLDKGSDKVLGFSPNKKISQNFLGGAKVKDIVECWEFSNNSRGYCSFRDPYNRTELSFIGPESEDLSRRFTSSLAPAIINSFEYRYSQYEDALDYILDFKSYCKNQEAIKTINKAFTAVGCEEISALQNDTLDSIKNNDEDKATLRKLEIGTAKLYQNYERVCQWLWKTNPDNVKSQGQYNPIDLGSELFAKNIYYTIESKETEDENGEKVIEYVYTLVEEFPSDKIVMTYYKKKLVDGQETYETVKVCNNSEYLYVINKYYLQAKEDLYYLATESFDKDANYYIFTETSDYTGIEPLIIPAVTYVPEKTYYTYNKEALMGQSIKEASADEVNAENVTNYYEQTTVKFANYNKEFKYDTKEYRIAKFMNELEKHFDLEYVSTYFIMTEVFECYDSRGKNCMMASWGPLEENGEYIWYPIFYDIDTQLGINNTGIPSFKYNVDATENNNYSTSDSILWNNFYNLYKGSAITQKYRQLRDLNSTFGKLNSPPLKDVDTIEKWYKFDPDTTSNIAARGQRPLIVTNLDEYFKYITITNEKAVEQGVGYLLGNDGTMTRDPNGTYFYALQGDRSQSRRQFLESRLEYIDSWLGQKNYERGGSNRIRGRISANDETAISDKWVETNDSPYWVNNIAFGTKSHDFDAEYWLTLTPLRSMYVTAGDDNENYAPQKYDGYKSVKYTLFELENGIRTSKNYPEQLLYIYGLNQMSDIGDLSRLYFREFVMEGKAPHLTKLKLGEDLQSSTDVNVTWYNKQCNGLTLSEMPLLKSMNVSNISFSAEQTIDLTESEKLTEFKGYNTSNLIQVMFAEGVALDTLYLPSSVKTLSLVQASNLTEMITNTPDFNPTTGTPKGLLIQGLTNVENDYSSSLTRLSLKEDKLGLNSYKLLEKLYTARKDLTAETSVEITGVDWCPYKKCDLGEEYDSNRAGKYYKDNGHYGFELYNVSTAEKFKQDTLDGKIYYKENEDDDWYIKLDNNKSYIDTLLSQLKLNNSFKNTKITGIIYIDNETSIKEIDVYNNLHKQYPEVQFFFKNIEPCNSIEFLTYNPKTGGWEQASKIDINDTFPSIEKIEEGWFNSPFDIYNPTRAHYDFLGWGTEPIVEVTIDTQKDNIIVSTEAWNALSLTAEKNTYVYYAIFEIHKYTVEFKDGDNITNLIDPIKVKYLGTTTAPTNAIPYKDDQDLELTKTYGFIGWTDNLNTNLVINLDKYEIKNNITFYPVFEEMSVYDNIHYDYFNFNDYSYVESVAGKDSSAYNAAYNISDGYQLVLKPNLTLTGKITIPTEYKNKKIIALNGFANQENITHVFMKDDKIRYIQDNCFKDCSKLIYIDFVSSIRVIGVKAFQNAKSLRCYNLPNNLFYIGAQAFNGAFPTGEMASIQISNELSYMGYYAFAYCKVAVGSSITIGSSAQKSKLNLSEVDSGMGGNYRYIRLTNNSGEGFTIVDFYTTAYALNTKVWNDHTVDDCFNGNTQQHTVVNILN